MTNLFYAFLQTRCWQAPMTVWTRQKCLSILMCWNYVFFFQILPHTFHVLSCLMDKYLGSLFAVILIFYIVWYFRQYMKISCTSLFWPFGYLVLAMSLRVLSSHLSSNFHRNNLHYIHINSCIRYEMKHRNLQKVLPKPCMICMRWLHMNCCHLI